MTDYISRASVLALAESVRIVSNGNYKSVVSAINAIPAADVVETDAIKNMVEVVMCRDCKRYTENCFCEFWQKTGAVIQMSTYDFCSYGERLEE